MQKILVIFIILPTFVYAAYNPFFNDAKPPQQPKTFQKAIIQQKKVVPTPKRKNIDMTYIGFIHSKKGKFALVSFSGNNIVIRKDDSLYLGEEIFKVKKITSNYILMTDRHYRTQTVYFTSEMKK